MFLRQMKKKKEGKTDIAGRMREGLKSMLIKEQAKDTVWKEWRKGLQRNPQLPFSPSWERPPPGYFSIHNLHTFL